MDGFTAYMKKHKSTFFLFFDTFAAVRYIRRCELVDLESGEVIAALKVGAMSDAEYSRKYRRLFLKSMLNNYLYVYDFNTGELKRLRKFGYCDREIFLTDDEENVIVFINRGGVQRVSVDTLEVSVLNGEKDYYFFHNGWDNPDLKCYEFFCTNSDLPTIFLRLDYQGKVLAEEPVIVDESEIRCNCVEFYREKNLYLFQCDKKDYSGETFYEPKLYTILSEKPNPSHDIKYLLEGYYSGGCCYITQYENYVFLCYGNDEVYVIDLDSRRVVKKYEVRQMSTIAQYDPRRNALFVSVWKNLVILGNVL